MSLDEWEIGDYVVGEVETTDHDEFGYLGTDEQVRILGEVGQNECVLAQITDTQAVGVVAESVSEIDSDAATVWVQRTADINPRDPDSPHPTETFDEMAGGDVADTLATIETTVHDGSRTGSSTDLRYGVGAITVGFVGFVLVRYGLGTVFPPDGLMGYVLLSLGLTVATPVLLLSLILVVAGGITATTDIKAAVRD